MENCWLRISDHWIRNWSGGRRNPMKNVQSIRKIYWYKERMGRCCDYPDFAQKACSLVQAQTVNFAILICGTGIGMSIAANKMMGIRAALCGDEFSAHYTRAHNNANVLTLGARVIGEGLAENIVDIFLNSSFEGGRHARRIDKITEIERMKSCTNL